MDIRDLDVVRLLRDLLDRQLVAGAVGTVVGVYPDGYLVEFADGNGETLALVDLYADQFEVVPKMLRPAGVDELS